MDFNATDLSDLLGDVPQTATALPTTVHERDLAALLGITRQAIGDHVRSGVLRRSGRAQFLLAETVKAYCEHLRQHARQAGRPTQGGDALKQARTRLAEEQAELTALKTAQARNELISAAEVTRQWETTLTDIRAALLAIPGRLQGIDRDAMTRVDGEIRAVLMELAENG